MASITYHDFYCIKCGKKGIPLGRNAGHQHAKFHRKKLYCVFCKEEINHVECRNPIEVEKFQQDFEKGIFKTEVEMSLAHTRKI